MNDIKQISIEETRDWEVVWRVSQDPAVADRVTNDEWGRLDVEVRQSHVRLIVENPDNHALLVIRDGAVAGCFIMDSKGNGVFEIHTMLLPTCRGLAALRAGKLAMQKALEFSGVERLVSYCPDNLPESFVFAKMCGWKSVGLAMIKWVKGGIEFPVHAVEITKGELQCL